MSPEKGEREGKEPTIATAYLLSDYFAGHIFYVATDVPLFSEIVKFDPGRKVDALHSSWNHRV